MPLILIKMEHPLNHTIQFLLKTPALAKFTQKFYVQIPLILPEGRHSHMAIKTKAGIVISGGLGENMNHVYNTVVIIYENDVWTLSTIEFDIFTSWS